MTGQRRANWEAKLAEEVAAAEVRVTVRIEAAEERATRRFDTVASMLDQYQARIEKLERWRDALVKMYVAVAIPVAILIAWAVCHG